MLTTTFNCCEHCIHWDTFNQHTQEYEPNIEGRVNDHYTMCLYNYNIPGTERCVDGGVRAERE